MRIDKRLNIVMPVESSDGKTVHVHAEPISLAVFEANALLIGKTFAAIFQEGLGSIAGPRVAAALMRRLADATGMRPECDALLNEIRRLANVVAPAEQGWSVFPLQEAVDQKYFDERALSEAENALVYFTVASSMHRKSDLAEILDGAAQLWGAQTTALNSTAFKDSLPISTATASSGERAGSSVPL